VRDLFVLNAFKLAVLTVAEEDGLMQIRNDGRLKLKHSSTDIGLILVVPLTRVIHRHKQGDSSISTFLYIVMCEVGYEHNK
jgi:hypothetical protein